MTSPSIIVDYRIDDEAVDRLRKIGTVFLFDSGGITLPSLKGHPDLFMTQIDNTLVIAPNTPSLLIQYLQSQSIEFHVGKRVVGASTQMTTPYNCLVTNNFVIHKRGFTDEVVLEMARNRLFIDVPQAFTRCSLFALDDDHFITSDGGIERVLINRGLACLYVSPAEIQLPPYKNGFIGGCLGRWNNVVFFSGAINCMADGDRLRNFVNGCGFSLVELVNGSPLDVGALFIL